MYPRQTIGQHAPCAHSHSHNSHQNDLHAVVPLFQGAIIQDFNALSLASVSDPNVEGLLFSGTEPENNDVWAGGRQVVVSTERCYEGFSDGLHDMLSHTCVSSGP